MSGQLFSFGAGIFLLSVSILVMKAYWPSWREPIQWLGLAIFVGFVAAAGNTLWWQIGQTIVLHFGLVDHATYQGIGWWLDILWKGGAGLAGIMHLVALQHQLPPKERKEWSWWDMPWYPRRKACATSLLTKLKRTKK